MGQEINQRMNYPIMQAIVDMVHTDRTLPRTDTEEREYCQELYDGPATPSQPQTTRVEPPPTRGEGECALTSVSQGKACGPDEFP